MKKSALILLALCACLLSACGKSDDRLSGKVVETSVNDSVGLVSFVVRTDENKEVGILLTDEMSVGVLVDGMVTKDFLSGTRSDVLVSVEYDRSQRTLTRKDGTQITAYNAKRVDVTGYRKDDVILSGGAAVECWQESSGVSYVLPDGTELLTVETPFGPKNVYVGGQESLDDLSESVQEKVIAYFDAQGLLYDETTELERAYADYCADSAAFIKHHVSQDVTPIASSEKVMYFLTDVSIPSDRPREQKELRLGTAFDRETGEVIDNASLFSCPAYEAERELLKLSQTGDASLQEELEQAFDWNNILFFPESLEINYPEGTLKSQEHSYLIGLDYDDALLSILNDWAVPTNGK